MCRNIIKLVIKANNFVLGKNHEPLLHLFIELLDGIGKHVGEKNSVFNKNNVIYSTIKVTCTIYHIGVLLHENTVIRGNL